MSSSGHSDWCGYPSEPCSATCKVRGAEKHYSEGYRARGRNSSPYIRGLYTRIRNLEAKVKHLSTAMVAKDKGEI